MTFREYADSRNITYEAVRQLVKKLSSELDGHITKQGRTRVLDTEAVKVLDVRRTGTRVSVIKPTATEDTEIIDKLKNEIILLQRELLGCKDDLRIASENVARLEAVSDTNKHLQDELDHKQHEIDTLRNDLGSYQRTVFGLYRKVKG